MSSTSRVLVGPDLAMAQRMARLRHALPAQFSRTYHYLNRTTPKIPSPTPFVPDVPTFLTLIGRDLSQHATKIPSWEALFSWNSAQFREVGIEPARSRRYLLAWRERFRNGVTGIGGDCKNVRDGVAKLRAVELQSNKPQGNDTTPKSRKTVANEKADEDGKGNLEEEGSDSKLPLVGDNVPTNLRGVKLLRGHYIAGSGVEQVKGFGVAQLRVKPGLWEIRRGHKVDGGERRKAEVRYKRRLAERRATA
ncbi:hypothetical protein K470DRAFT_259864 [Piedraia hortae CBS 480.64]|uniref:Small ribosomal subunit protein mS41 n=1 Tax=Piedraia hortae CBS 480.64 TaxID=1314780 RepID=A0A6A7BV41_9PEZI|nr:hypothetical protein K470DRAFT_259864 [Piedraia hortae CBS 480.64]